MRDMQAVYFCITCVLTFVITALVRIAMRHWKVVDIPKTEKRKIHKKKIPLGGGLAIYFSLFFMISMAFLFGMIGEHVTLRTICLVAVAGLVLMIGGVLDDAKTLRPVQQIWFPVIAAGIIAVAGIRPSEITNPFVGTLPLGSIVGAMLVFVWLLTMMFTTKFLDGLDGLVSGVVTIGALMIFFLSREPEWWQPEVATIAILFAGACLGFLVWNWHPAKIFLGEGGSLFTGFFLGVLAIMSGGKIMTTLLVVGIPLLDVIRVMYVRWRNKKPLHVGDNEHLHFKLIRAGMSQKQAVLLLYALSFSFGVTTLFLQSKEKLVAFAFLFVLLLLMTVYFQPGKEQ